MQDHWLESDEELVEKAMASGESRYFEPLIERHAARIQSLIYHMLGHRADSEELVQDTFIRAYDKLASFNHRSSFATWLYRIAINLARDQQRRRARRPATTPDRLNECPAPAHSTPAAAAVGRELDQAIEQALDKLSPKLKTAIVCHTIEGMSIATIARIERCAQGTIYWRLHLARKQLRKMLTPFTR